MQQEQGPGGRPDTPSRRGFQMGDIRHPDLILRQTCPSFWAQIRDRTNSAFSVRSQRAEAARRDAFQALTALTFPRNLKIPLLQVSTNRS